MTLALVVVGAWLLCVVACVVHLASLLVAVVSSFIAS